jgi:hypothetical protein
MTPRQLYTFSSISKGDFGVIMPTIFPFRVTRTADKVEKI